MILSHHPGTAIAYKEKRISYADLLAAAQEYAALYSSVETERIAVFAENRPEWVYAFYSGWLNKRTVVPIDYMSKAGEVSYILNDCKPGVIFCSSGTKEVLGEALTMTEHSPLLLDMDSITLRTKFNSEMPGIDYDTQSTAVIIYTSGTTGSPKGVMLSFDNLMANIEGVTAHIPIYTPERNVMVLLPLHHIFPLLGSMVAPLFAGAAIAITPSMRSEDIIATLKEHRIAIIIGVPRLYEAILKGIMTKIKANKIAALLFRVAKRVNSRTFSQKIFKKVHETFGGNVQYMVCGGAKLPEEIGYHYRALGFEMLEGFGMTEAAPMITFTRPGRWLIGSAGEALPGTEIAAENGEIIARGRNIMQGYFNRPEETAEMLRGGWLHTGDLGYVDTKGFIHITGRSKDIIVLSNGKNINPEEIEIPLRERSPLIQEAAVFAHQDRLNCIVFPDVAKIREQAIPDIESYLRENVFNPYNQKVSSYKQVSKIYIASEELPKTRLGKIQRFKLVSLIDTNGKDKIQQEEPDFEEYKAIRDFLKERRNREIFPDDHFEFDLALDSLEKVNFQVFLESTFGIHLDQSVFHNHPTVEKIARLMKEQKNRFQVEKVKWSEILREKVDHALPKSWFTHNIFKNISKAFLKMYFRIEVSGTENIPEGPFILAPNHQSFFDGLFVVMNLKKRTLKNTYFYAKSKHIRFKLVKFIARTHNVIVMDINKDLKASMQKLAAVLREKKM